VAADALNKVDGPLIRLLPVQRAIHPVRQRRVPPAPRPLLHEVDGPLIRLLSVQRAIHPVRQPQAAPGPLSYSAAPGRRK